MTEDEKQQANTDEGPTNFEKWKQALNHDRIFQKVSFPPSFPRNDKHE